MSKFEEIKDKVSTKIHEVKADHETGVDAAGDRLEQGKFETEEKLDKLDSKI